MQHYRVRAQEGSQAFLRASEPIDGVLSQGRRVVYVGVRSCAANRRFFDASHPV